MIYLRVRWIHDSPGEPVTLYSELDADRWETRKVDVFRDGRMQSASVEGYTNGTDLGEAQTPPLEALASDAELEPVEITAAEFEEVWTRCGPPRVVVRCETGEDVEVPGVLTLTGATLTNANLHRALLEDRDLRGCDFSGCDFRSAWLDGAMLDDARLVGARFPAASALRTRFVRANLTHAFLRSAEYEEANFTGANLRDADIGRANLRGATLLGADMRARHLDEADLTGATADATTVWPDGYDPVAHGVRVD